MTIHWNQCDFIGVTQTCKSAYQMATAVRLAVESRSSHFIHFVRFQAFHW